MENMGDLYCEVGMTVSDPTKLLKHLTVSIYIITLNCLYDLSVAFVSCSLTNTSTESTVR